MAVSGLLWDPKGLPKSDSWSHKMSKMSLNGGMGFDVNQGFFYHLDLYQGKCSFVRGILGSFRAPMGAPGALDV